ncbi:MAG: DUF4199 domain-containing protein [Ignavibacteriaceae bacterium]
MKKFFPSLVSGFVASVFSIIPLLKSFSCCLLVPAAAVLALFLDRRINNNLEKITIKKALLFGFLTGIFAAFFITSFDLLMTYLTKTNDLITSLPQTEVMLNDWNLGPMMEQSITMLKQMADEINSTGFSMLYAFMILFSNLISNTIFGMIGGALGMVILNKKTY